MESNNEMFNALMNEILEMKELNASVLNKFNKMMEQDVVLLNKNQAAQVLGVSLSTFYRMVKKGHVKKVTRSGRTGYLKSDLLNIIA